MYKSYYKNLWIIHEEKIKQNTAELLAHINMDDWTDEENRFWSGLRNSQYVFHQGFIHDETLLLAF